MSENKYQEALDTISEMPTMNLLTIGERYITKPLVALLQELVDKETPMKPIDQYKGYLVLGNMGTCGRCGRSVDYHHIYCPRCSQKLDWSDEE